MGSRKKHRTEGGDFAQLTHGSGSAHRPQSAPAATESREACGVRGACSRFCPPLTIRKRRQAGRTPYAPRTRRQFPSLSGFYGDREAFRSSLGRVCCVWLGLLVLATACQCASAPGEPLQVSVYCTAGDVQRHLATAEGRQQTLRRLEPLHVTHLFLEGRRGDEYVPASQLRELREYFATNGIHCSGGIATVPGRAFGTRQKSGLEWLNWESPKSRADVTRFFAEDAPLFDELIVDDFFCTGDVSSESERAKGARSWGEYRRDLLVGLIKPVMRRPAQNGSRRTRLIIKFPQWYDRFQLFGYDPPRMSAQVDQVWVGTEVRDPDTQRMGFVQPTEGYMNFRWLSSQAGVKVRGAWFDHIECSAQQFVDQAYQSVLAGAEELTLFRLGDLMEGHPGDAFLASRMPHLMSLAEHVRGKSRLGIAYYKPPGSEGDENLYLADYLGMVGLPILPEASYPKYAAAAFLPVQAAADAMLLDKMRRHLKRGAVVVVTPALLRALGSKAAGLAGIDLGPKDLPALAPIVRVASEPLALETPLEIDAAIEAHGCEVSASAFVSAQPVPLLTRRAVERGELWVLNVRTFSDRDFRGTGERLLAPRQLGLPRIPQPLADLIRASLMKPFGKVFRAPAGVALVLFDRGSCVYNFHSEPVRVQLGEESVDLAANACLWRE